jgi:hypothetical protein
MSIGKVQTDCSAALTDMIYPYVFCAAGTLFFYTGPSAMELSRQDGMEWRKELRLREGHSKDVTCFRSVGLRRSMQRLCYCLMQGQEQVKAVLVHYLPEGAASGGKSEGGIASKNSKGLQLVTEAGAQHAGSLPPDLVNRFKVRPVKGKSRYRGVSWVSKRNMWQVYVSHHLNKHFVGYFDDEEEAARAWDKTTLRIK